MIELITNPKSILLCVYCTREGIKIDTPKAIHVDYHFGDEYSTSCCGNPRHCQGDEQLEELHDMSEELMIVGKIRSDTR